MYFSGQGKVLVAPIDLSTGKPGGYYDLGNCSSLELTLGQAAMKYATGGGGALPKFMETGELPTFKIMMDDVNTANLALLLQGERGSAGVQTVTSETVIGYRGRWTPLAHMNITTFTSLTNATNTTTYARGTHFLLDYKTGMIFIPETSPITDGQSLRANYATNGYATISAFTINQPYYAVRFAGMNSADKDEPVVVDLYRTKLYPVETLPLISADLIEMTVNGKMYLDTARPFTTAAGQFFGIRRT